MGKKKTFFDLKYFIQIFQLTALEMYFVSKYVQTRAASDENGKCFDGTNTLNRTEHNILSTSTKKFLVNNNEHWT